MGEDQSYRDAIAGCLIGTAIGDSIGLPFEGMRRRRLIAWRATPFRQRFVFGRGFCSDDTEHAAFVLKTMLIANGDIDRFRRLFARRLKWWLLSAPAGIGMATLKACLKLLIGVPATKSGVVSAGNGPAMRAPIIGLIASSVDEAAEFAAASARVTHRDPRAIDGAVVVAIATWLSRENSDARLRDVLRISKPRQSPNSALHQALLGVVESLDRGESTSDYCEREFGDSVSGFVMHTIPAAFHAWQSHRRDFRAAIESVVSCGGDTDTTAAIVGALVGTSVGRDGIPREWRDRYVDWPLSLNHLEGLATSAANSDTISLPRLNPVAVVVRNVLFTAIVLAHGFRRLAPPY